MEDRGDLAQDRLADYTGDRRILILSAMALVIGAISSLVAYALVWLIALFTNLFFFQRLSAAEVAPAQHQLGYLVIIVPAVGGLIIGLMARYGSPKIRGHGIPEALEAILIGRSRMQPKVALLKPISSALSIGSGGPFGAEGPIIMTGGAVGSLFAQFFQLSSAERKTLLVAGAAAGMSAIFATPVAAALLAVELLLFELKPRSLVPVAVASAMAAVLRVPLLGAGPLFPIIPHPQLAWQVVAIAAALGLFSGLGSALLTKLVYTCEDLFERLPIHWMWWPTIGGLIVGVGGLLDPRVMGVGYELIHGMLRGEMVGGMLLGLLVLKALVWSIALGSGTSGGVLAPLLILGGALGALASQLIPVQDPGLWAMVGMAAIMSATMRAPLTAVIFTLELTHDLGALPALLAGCTIGYAFTVLVMRRSILTEKVARHGLHVLREYSVDPLQLVRISEVMDTQVTPLPADTPLSRLSERIARNDPQVTGHQATLLASSDGRLCGIITRGDLVRALGRDPQGTLPVLEAGTSQLLVCYPDELLSVAVAKMLEHDIGRLPVVSREDSQQLLGYVGRAIVLKARLQHHQEEHQRDPGWLRLSQAAFARSLSSRPR